MPSSSLARRLGGVAAATTVAVSTLTALATVPAAADITRCVGAVQTPGAFACYTSPRFNQSGFETQDVATFPIVCYGIGCTSSELTAYMPSGDATGRFTSVSYLGHAYTIYRPAQSQPYVLTSDNPRLDTVTEAEVLALSAALDTANGL